MARVITIIPTTARRVLRLIYDFDKWHISPLGERPYARDIIRYCNNLSQKNSFIEIGCGLGDIIRNVNFRSRTGYDAEEAVLKAARFLAKINNEKDIEFGVFQFPASVLNIKSDVIIMVNWIHNIEPNVLREKIGQYFHHNLLPGGQILIDTVQDKEYSFNHNISFLTKDLACKIARIGEYSRQREVWAIIQ